MVDLSRNPSNYRFSDEELKGLRNDVDQLKLEFAKMSVREEQTQMALNKINISIDKIDSALGALNDYNIKYGESLTMVADFVKDLQGVSNTRKRLQKIFVWWLSLPVVGGMTYWLMSKF